MIYTLFSNKGSQIKLSNFNRYDIAARYKWTERSSGNNLVYLFTFIEGKKHSFGKIVFGLKKDQCIIHTTNDTFDYCDDNIVICNKSHFGHYCGSNKSFKKTNYHSVYYDPYKASNYVRVVKEGSYVPGGYFKSDDDASIVADYMSVKLYGSLANRNYPELSNIELEKRYNEILDRCGKDSRERISFSQQGVSRYKGIKTSQYIGVSKDKNKWAARFKYQKKQIHLGNYNDDKMAAHAYDLKALQMRGIYAKTNFPLEFYIDNGIIKVKDNTVIQVKTVYEIGE